MCYFEPDNGGSSNAPHQRELRVEEVLERLLVPRETLIKWLQDRELKGRRIAERKGGWRVRTSDLEWFIHVRGLESRP